MSIWRMNRNVVIILRPMLYSHTLHFSYNLYGDTVLHHRGVQIFVAERDGVILLNQRFVPLPDFFGNLYQAFLEGQNQSLGGLLCEMLVRVTPQGDLFK